MVGWLAGSGGGQDREAGLAGWLARWDGRQGGWRAMDLWSKEFSSFEVNIVM